MVVLRMLCSLGLAASLSLFSVPGCRASIRDKYFEGIELFRQDRIKDAHEIWASLLTDYRDRLSPKQVKALSIRLRQTKLILATTQRARRSFMNQALIECNKGAAILAVKGPALKAAGYFENAISKLEEAAAAGEQDKRYPYVMAYCLIYTGRAEQARVFVEQAQKALPGDPRALNLKSEYFRLRGKISLQIKTLKESISLSFTQPGAHYMLAKALLKRRGPGDIDEAYRYAKTSIVNNKERAYEFSQLFPEAYQRDEFHGIATSIAIREQKARYGR